MAFPGRSIAAAGGYDVGRDADRDADRGADQVMTPVLAELEVGILRFRKLPHSPQGVRAGEDFL
jgi:hypothetical protein